MAAQVVQASGRGRGEEGLGEGVVGEMEADIDRRAVRGGHRSAVEAAAAVDRRVQRGGLAAVGGAHRGEPAGFGDPLEDQAGEVDRQRRRRIEAAVGLGLAAVVERRGHRGRGAFEQVLAHHQHAQPGDAEVLLRAGVEQAEAGDVERRGEQARGGVGHQRDVAGVGQGRVGEAVDRLVGGDVAVGAVGGQIPAPGRRCGERRVAREAGCGDRLAVAARLGDRALRPVAGVGVGRAARAAEQVHRHQRELMHGAAGEEEDAVAGGQLEELRQALARAVQRRAEGVAGEGALERRGAVRAAREQAVARALEHRVGQARRAGGEVPGGRGVHRS